MLKYFLILISFVNIFLYHSSIVYGYYDDVNENYVYYEAIQRLYKDGVLSPKQFFRPNDLINQAEFLALLLKGAQIKVNSNDMGPYMEDVPYGHWVNPYIKKALDLNILSGRSNYFYPSNPVSKAEALRLIFLAFKIKMDNSFENVPNIVDVKKTDFFAPVFYKAILMDLIQIEPDGKVYPLENITRGFAAQLIYAIRLSDPIILSDKLSGSGNYIDIELQKPSIFQKIEDIWSIINQEFLYKDKINDKAALDQAIKAVIKTLNDPYTNYFTKEESLSYEQELKGEIVGIGIHVIEENNKKIISFVIKDSPAYKAGLKAKDVILKVDNFDTKDLSLDELIDKIRGKIGTYVNIKISRNNEEKTYSIKREKIIIPSISLEDIYYNSNVYALLKINNFGENTYNQFLEIVQKMKKNKLNYKGILLDLRDNPGGYLETAVDIASFFLKNNDVITKTIFGNNNVISYVVTLPKNQEKGEFYDIPIIVLQNENTASAAEILSGALKYLRNVLIIGKKSFGKGTVQSIKRFEDGSLLKLTVAKWLLPDNKDIDNKGIEPDVFIYETGSTVLENKLDDVYIKKALERFNH